MVVFYRTTLGGSNSIRTLTKNENNYKPSNDSNVHFQVFSFMKYHSLACPVIASLNYYIIMFTHPKPKCTVITGHVLDFSLQEQYRFIFDLMIMFLESFSIYSNFK